MGKIKNFEISFSGNKAIYFPGDTISGTLSLKIDKPMKMRQIKIECMGKAYVHWTETRTVSNGKTTTTYTEHYRAEEKYFKFSNPVAGKGVSGNNNDSMMLPAGSQVYNFSFQLPQALPSSFEGGIGWVRYSVKGSIDRPWKFDHTTKTMFTVLDSLDLNAEPYTRELNGVHEGKFLCCWCCQSGPIEADVHTERRGYVPGEVILLNANLENHSNSKVKRTNAYLKQEFRFITSRKTKTVTKNITKVEGRPGCGRHSSVKWTNERIQIPAVPPSILRHCKIIDINYYIEFEGCLRSCSLNLRAKLPLVIGTVPLTGVQPSTMDLPPTYTAAAPSAPPALGVDNQGFSNPPAPAYQPPPPSYMSAIGSEPVSIREEGDHDRMMGEATYNPQYAYYDWSQTAFKYN